MKRQNIELITLDGWKLFSERKNSTNYISEDGTKMLKVFTSFTKMDEKGLIREKRISDLVYKMNISTPKTYKIVKVGDGYGIISEYISAKRSISRIISESYDNKDKYIKIFADFTKDIHSKQCNSIQFVSVKKLILDGLKQAYFFNDVEKKNIKKLLKDIPNTKNCLVRDYQFSNVIIDGNDNPYLIDLGTVCYGHEDFDLAFLYYFTHYIEERVVNNILHITYPQANECWDRFIKYYFPHYSLEEIENKNKYLSKLSLVMILSQINTLNVIDLIADVKHKSFEDTYK